MTAEPTATGEAEEQVEPLRFATAQRAPEPIDRIPFQLDDDDTVLYAVRPKMGQLLGIAGAVSAILDPKSDLHSQMGAAAAVLDFTNVCFDAPTRVYLQERFDDPDDPLDVGDLAEPIQFFIGRWFARPTGSPSGSVNGRQRSGKRSTGRRRSPASTP